MASLPEKKEDEKSVPRLRPRPQLFIDTTPLLNWTNHEEVIQQLCENSVRLEESEDELKFIEWAKDKYLQKVRYEYPTEGDERATRLNRVVWTGRFREIARDYFQEKRDKKKRDSCFCC